MSDWKCLRQALQYMTQHRVKHQQLTSDGKGSMLSNRTMLCVNRINVAATANFLVNASPYVTANLLSSLQSSSMKWWAAMYTNVSVSFRQSFFCEKQYYDVTCWSSLLVPTPFDVLEGNRNHFNITHPGFISFFSSRHGLRQWLPTFFMPWPTCRFQQNVVAHYHRTIEKSTLSLHLSTNMCKQNKDFMIIHRFIKF